MCYFRFSKLVLNNNEMLFLFEILRIQGKMKKGLGILHLDYFIIGSYEPKEVELIVADED